MNPVSPILGGRELEQVRVAENQPEYITLPTHYHGNIAFTLWKLSWKERIQILLLGKFWHAQLTFRKPMQPIRMTVMPPKELTG